ncbi:MAG: hypothetical protein ACSLFI_03640 [Solirubrobacterales bacterium]
MESGTIDTTLEGGAPTVAVGKGTCALLRGSCRVDRPRITEPRLLVDGVEAPVTRFTESRAKDAGDQSWWSVVDFPKVNASRLATLELDVRIGFRHRVRAPLGTIEIKQGWRAPRLAFTPGQFDIDGSVTGALALRPLVVICVATSSPSIAALERFIDQMTKQSYENWTCTIRDGGSSSEHFAALLKVTEKHTRVEIHKTIRHGRGRYSSVERAMMDTPAHAPYAVLTALENPWSDPSTLERLISGFAPGVNAVASVVNSLDPGPIAWRRELTNYVLPLPPAEQNGGRPARWILAVASALGNVQYQALPEMEVEVSPGASDGNQLQLTPEAKLIAETLTDRILQLRCGAFLSKQSRRRVSALEKAGRQRVSLHRRQPSA